MTPRPFTVTVLLLAGWSGMMPSAQDRAFGTGPLSGIVIEDHTGRPLAGASVRLVQGGRVLATAESDADGRFLVRGAGAGGFVLEVEKLHHVPVAARFPRDAGGPLPALRLIRHGAVSGATSDPRAGSFTVVERVPAGVVPRRPGTGARESPDAFRLFGLPPGVYAVLGQPVRDGRSLTGFTTPLSGSPDLVISGGEEHAGIHAFPVVDESAPVIARIDASAFADPLRVTLSLVSPDHPAFPLRTVLVPAAGAFTFEDVIPGVYELRARGQIGLRTVAFGRASVVVTGRDAAGATVSLQPGGEAFFTLAEATGTAAPACGSSARLTLTPLDYWAPDAEKSAVLERGEPRRIESLAPGRYRVTAAGAGGQCAAAVRTLDLSAATAAVRETLVLAPLARLRIMVSADADRSPAAVVVSDMTPGRTSPVRVALTHGGGSFDLEELPEGLYHVGVHDPAGSTRWAPDRAALGPLVALAPGMSPAILVGQSDGRAALDRAGGNTP